jgi:beta-aspartyl-peptidase (threonine type)
MFGIAIHGGAGTILRSQMSAEKEAAYKKALSDALHAGYEVLKKKGSSLDAVTAAVVSLENNHLFNAGRGSVFTFDEKHEMDASIMTGYNLDAGAVAGVTRIKNPILAARAVMEKSEHVMLACNGAEQFASEQQLEFADENYFYDEHRHQQWVNANKEGKIQLDHADEKKFGTVGAVALDLHNNLAAATSTGGMTNKRYQRIGDSPVIGSGTYANNKTCAISCTGHGEYFLRAVVAYDISCLIEYSGLTLQQACEKVVNDKLVKLGGEGGLVAIDTNGNICMPFNSDGMYRAFKNAEGEKIEIYR